MNRTQDAFADCLTMAMAMPYSSNDKPPSSIEFRRNLRLRNSRIAFGSCNSQYYENPFWDIIRERHPTAFVWAGDAVYADDRDECREECCAEKDSTLEKMPYATPEYLRELLTKQLQVESYKRLLQDNHGGTNISIFGTIDDHDFGINNGDNMFPFGKENGWEFTKFLGLTKETSAMGRRAANGLGVYGVQVYDFSSLANKTANPRLLTDLEARIDPDVVDETGWIINDEASSNNQLVAVFVLDVRTNKTPWKNTFPERYSMDAEGDFLGEEQWKWFENAIGRSNASVNIVVSGIQVHAPWFYDSNKIENWR